MPVISETQIYSQKDLAACDCYSYYLSSGGSKGGLGGINPMRIFFLVSI